MRDEIAPEQPSDPDLHPRSRLGPGLLAGLRPPVLLIVLLVAVQFAIDFSDLWSAGGAAELELRFAIVPAMIREGQWWRILTGSLMHSGWGHLGGNVAGFLLLGPLTVRILGSLGFCWLVLVGMIAGALATGLAGHEMSMGSSGGVMALLGAGLVFLLRVSPRLHRSNRIAAYLGLLSLPFIYLLEVWPDGAGSVHEGINHAAHLAGFLAGIVFALVWTRGSGNKSWKPETKSMVLLTRWGRRRGGELVLAVLVASVLLSVISQLSAPLSIPLFSVEALRVVDDELLVPSDCPYGRWQGGRCRLTELAPAAVAQAEEILCFRLPLGGVLLLARPDRLLTMDKHDLAVLRDAKRLGVLRRLQAGVLVASVGRGHVEMVLANERLLDAYQLALDSTLRSAGSGSMTPALSSRGGASSILRHRAKLDRREEGEER